MNDNERALLLWCGIMLVRSTPLRAFEADEIDALIASVRKDKVYGVAAPSERPSEVLAPLECGD